MPCALLIADPRSCSVLASTETKAAVLQQQLDDKQATMSQLERTMNMQREVTELVVEMSIERCLFAIFSHDACSDPR